MSHDSLAQGPPILPYLQIHRITSLLSGKARSARMTESHTAVVRSNAASAAELRAMLPTATRHAA
jgi:hypothetical protein